jgi:hypothetical protein
MVSVIESAPAPRISIASETAEVEAKTAEIRGGRLAHRAHVFTQRH